MDQYASATRMASHESGPVGGMAVAAPTLGGALAVLTDIGELANGAADHAERLANHLAGVAPTGESLTKGRRDIDCLTDALNERAEAVRDPIVRIRNALARIERRLG
ncbi:hypothetical protein [Methylorubrum sp. POS3]|uniref:hypothetical protein n=1 Tax=Methylorubrum sp. POS3 TaxID=2998492 RepID=UPI00372BCFFC